VRRPRRARARLPRGDGSLGERLRAAAPLDEAAAGRGWEAVRAAHAAREPMAPADAGHAPARTAGRAREPVARRRRRAPSPLHAMLAVALVGLLAALALSPAGARVTDWIDRAIGPPAARPAATLPAPGRLLVSGRNGSWIVEHDLKTVSLAEFTEADWSAKGNYVLLNRHDELFVRDARGKTYWTLARPRIGHLAWSGGDGYRVAYRSGRQLRVVAGDGSGDRLIEPVTGEVTPSWRPGRAGAHVLAYALPRGQVNLRDVDGPRTSGRVLLPPGRPVESLAWVTPDRLLVLRAGRLLLVDGAGRVLSRMARPGDGRITALTASSSTRSAAFVWRGPRDRTSVVWSVRFPVRRAGAGRAAAPGRAGADAAGAAPQSAGGAAGMPTPRREGAGADAAGAAPQSAGTRLLGGHARIAFAGVGRIDSLAFSPDGRWLAFAWPPSDQWIFQRVRGRPRLMTVQNVTRRLGHLGDPADSAIVGWAR
jgi:hypothetical protein